MRLDDFAYDYILVSMHSHCQIIAEDHGVQEGVCDISKTTPNIEVAIFIALSKKELPVIHTSITILLKDHCNMIKKTKLYLQSKY